MNYKLIPPTGHKIFLRDIFNLSKHGLPADNCYYLNSGTSALFFVIKYLNIQESSNIIIPSYSCPTVASAVLKAGHKPVLCDIQKETLFYDAELLQNRIKEVNARAVIFVNLFGLNKEIPQLDIPVILDNAQQYLQNKKVENIAAQIYSFGRGKPVNSMSGGLAVINDNVYFKNINENYGQIPAQEFLTEIKYLLTLFSFKIFSIPYFYKIIYSIPFLHLGETIFDENFPVNKISRLNKKVISNIMDRVNKIKKMRSLICIEYKNLLEEYLDKLHLWKGKGFYRFPVLLKEEGERDILVKKLQDEGVGAFPLYPWPLNRQPGLDKILNNNKVYKNAEFISENLFTLPVNEYVKQKDIIKIKEIFKNNL